MTDHTATLMAFARGAKVERPSDEALFAALRDGLCSISVRTRTTATSEDTSRTWRLTPRGVEALRAHLDSLPPASRPTPVKRRRQKPRRASTGRRP